MTRILSLLLCLVLTACSPIFGESECSNELVNTATSGNGRFVASLIRRNCGATAAYSNLVFLKNADDPEGKDGVWGEKVYVSRGEIPIALRWNDAELKIKAPTAGKDVFLKKDNWTSVRITYE